MADIFDPINAQKEMAKRFEETERVREETSGVIARSTEQMRAANEARARNVQLFGERAETQFDRMSTALDNLSEIASFPEGIANLIGLFDDDFNRNFQLQQLQKSEFELNRIETQRSNAETSASLVASGAALEVESALQQFNFTRQGFLDTVSALELGFTIEENVRKADLDQAANMSIEQLQQFAADPSKAPGGLKDKPGLLQSVLIDKMSQEAGLSSQLLANQINKEALDRNKRENFMRKFTNEQLQSMINTNKFAGDLDLGTTQDELNRRISIQEDLTSARISNEAGEMALANSKKATALNNMTMIELQTGLAGATEAGGRIKFEGIDFTATELRATLLQKQQLEREATNAALSRVATKAAVAGDAAELGALQRGLTGAVNPGTPFNESNPSESLPPEIRAKMSGFSAQLQAMEQLQASGVDTSLKQAEIIKEAREAAAAFKEKFIENQPDEVQAGYRQYIESGGFIDDVTAASSFLAGSAAPNALNYDVILGRPFENFSNVLNELAATQVQSIGTASIGSEGGGTLEVKKKKELEPQQLVNEALRQSGAAQDVAQMFTQKVIADTIQNLQGGNQDSIWKGIVGPRGKFDERVFEETETADGRITTAFSFKKLAQLLAAKTVVFRETGAIQPGESMIEIVVNKALENSVNLRNAGTNDPTAAAFMKMAFNNNPQLAVMSIMKRFSDQEQPALAAVLEQKRLLEQQGKAIAQAAGEAQSETERNALESTLEGFSFLSPRASQVRKQFNLDQPPEPTEFEQQIRDIFAEQNTGGSGLP